MKYAGLPAGMWLLFSGSFYKHLITVLGYDVETAKTVPAKLKLYEYVPAMCRFDYAMSEAGGVSEFVRKYTLASGGPYCDCGYKKS